MEKKGELPCTGSEANDLLDQLLDILDRDPLIDEIGFIHPSQLLALCEEADAVSSSGRTRESADVSLEKRAADCNSGESRVAAFWNKDHKLGISTQYLPPLYTAARNRFMAALAQYKASSDSYVEHEDGYDELMPVGFAFSDIERRVMRYSKALLVLCGDFGTAWNSRKLIGSKKQLLPVFEGELRLSTLVLSFAPKAEAAWAQRRWVIKMIAGKCANLEEILKRESELVEKLAERSKMNYRAWNHRSWLVAFMSKEQVLHELTKSRNWAGLHIADNSCFHYRRKLMLRILDDAIKEQDLIVRSSQLEVLFGVWKEELDWNEILIRQYVGREALWLHRRFLSILWAEHIASSHLSISQNHAEESDDTVNHLDNFLDHELQLHHDCSRIADSDYEDFHKQTVDAASYILWLDKQISRRPGINFVVMPGADDLRALLHNICPERAMIWDHFLLPSMEPLGP